jgi:hypothetical protein
MHKTRPCGHYDREITTTSRRGRPLRGRMSVHDGAVSITTPDGRRQVTHVGGSLPHSLALMMLVDLEEERLGNPKYSSAGTPHVSAR